MEITTIRITRKLVKTLREFEVHPREPTEEIIWKIVEVYKKEKGKKTK